MKKIDLTLIIFPLLIVSCSKTQETFSQEPPSNEDIEIKEEVSLKDRLHNAYLDVIEAKEENIRSLLCLDENDDNFYWNETKDKVLLFTFHRYPSSYPDGEEITFTWGESWVCSLKEYKNWYLNNIDNIKDPLLRTKQVLGMSDESKNTYITSMWFDPKDVCRPAYVTNTSRQMSLQFDDDVTEEYKEWFINQYYYSYDVAKLPWTRLGYTYDWSEEAKDKYGLTEFIAWKGTTITVDKTLAVEEFVSTFTE